MATKRKKVGRPKATGRGALIGVRAQKPFLARLDIWRDAQDDKPSRPEAIRRLLEFALSAATKPGRPTQEATHKASRMAGEEIDRLVDRSAPTEEQEKRKRRLLKGPSEFREMRDKASRPKVK